MTQCYYLGCCLGVRERQGEMQTVSAGEWQ
jgi:hypothetical protein